MGWLSQLGPNNRHQRVRTDRFDSVGDQSPEKSNFRRGGGSEGRAHKAFLSCSSNPGIGKTYLRYYKRQDSLKAKWW